MKKLSFFLMAMLISLVSFAAEETGTLTFDDKAKRITFTTSQQVWTENGITVTNDKASSSSNVADYAKPARFYKSSKITVKCDLGTITKIVFDCNSSSYATALKNSITSGTVTASSDKVTVVPATESDTYVINSLTGGQVRMDALTVTYVAEEEDPYAPVYTITATSADEIMGTVEGAGEYTEGKTVTLIAKANPGYEFVKWSNESTDNPLVFEATENVTLTASFQAQTPITIAEANKLADTKTCILKEVTVSYVYKSYIHIQDASGYGMIFQNNFGLKAGDVVTGLTCQKTTYNGLPQFVPTCTKADLTIVAGEAPAVAELTTAPTGNYHQVVKLMNVKMTGSFTTSSNSTLTATCPDGKTIAIYNGKNHAYTFVASKTYNITGDVCQYSGKIQVSAYAIEEYVAPEPCTLATPVNWDAPIAAEANTDKWYAVNIASAKEAAKDLDLTVSNPGEEAVKVTVEVYADCPATELIAESTATINAGASKTKTVGYFDIFADLVDVIYFHVITEGGEIKVEAETAKFNVTATAENGTVEGAGVYEQGAEATLTATPAEGYEFVNWTIAGEEVSTENPYKFTVTADVALVANFKKAAPAMETVYFVNAQGWTGTIKVYAWDPANAAWPGAAATKEAEQIGGYDVYSYTAEAGKYANVIFNGTGGQTADLKWTAGKYYVLDGWYTKEEAEAKLATPIVDEVVYFVNNKKWSKVNAYAWDPANAAWPGKAATKEAEQIGGFDVYSYSAAPGTYQKVIFNNGGSEQTADMVWTAGKYIVNNQWYTKEEAEAALAAPVVTTWTMVGDKALFGTEWDLNNTANDLVKQEDGSWVLTLTNKTLAAKSYEYKAAKDRSWTTTVPGGNNAKLTISKAGQYDITFTLNAAATSVTAKATYIPVKYNVTVTAENGTVEGAGEYEEGATATLTATAAEGYEFVNWTVGEEVVSTENPYTFTVNADVALVANFQEAAPEYEVMELTMTNLTVGSYGDGITGLSASDMDNGIEVMLFLDAEGNLMEESSIMVGWSDYAVTGTVTKAYNEELATDVYTAELYTTVGETNYKLIITMYYVPVEATVVVVENATIDDQTETSGFLYMNGEWTDAEGIVYPVSAEVPGFDATVSEAVYSNVTVTVGGWGDNDPWLGFVQGDATVTVADNVVTLVGTAMSSWDGLVLDVTITGNLPVVEPTTITWELNGGELPAVEVPTNAELWEAFKPYYNEYYGLARADQPIDKVTTFANAKMQEIMTDEASEYKWLGDYVQSVATAAGVPLSTDMASANEGGWRWAVHAFFNAAAGQYGATGIDFTEAGKQEVWGAAYEAEYGVVLPTEPVAEDYVLPTPTKEGYTFVGWYDNAEGTGEPYKVIPAGWAGTLYAIWKQDTTTALDNIAVEGKAVKAIINGQLIIIKNGVQYNAQGVILK